MPLNKVDKFGNSQPLRPTTQREQIGALRLADLNKNNISAKNTQSFSSKDQYDVQLKQKYDLACQMAAFYKTKYEELAGKGNCVV